MKFKCDCGFHLLEIDIRPLKGMKEDYIGLTIYNHRSEKTGKYFKKPVEIGTVILIAEEARKFKKEITKGGTRENS